MASLDYPIQSTLAVVLLPGLYVGIAMLRGKGGPLVRSFGGIARPGRERILGVSMFAAGLLGIGILWAEFSDRSVTPFALLILVPFVAGMMSQERKPESEAVGPLNFRQQRRLTKWGIIFLGAVFLLILAVEAASWL